MQTVDDFERCVGKEGGAGVDGDPCGERVGREERVRDYGDARSMSDNACEDIRWDLVTYIDHCKRHSALPIYCMPNLR